MAKTKKKGKSPVHNQEKDPVREKISSFVSTINFAIKQGELPNAYKSVLRISDDSLLRNFEKSSTKEDVAAVRCFFFSRIPVEFTAGKRKQKMSIMEHLTLQDKDYGIDFIKTMVIELMGAAYKMEYGDRTKFRREGIQIDEDVFQTIPEEWLSDRPNSARIENIAHINHVDLVEQGYQNYLHWDKLFSGSYVNGWAKNILRLFRSTFSEEVREKYEAAREECMTAFISAFLPDIPNRKIQTKKLLQDTGIPVSLLDAKRVFPFPENNNHLNVMNPETLNPLPAWKQTGRQLVDIPLPQPSEQELENLKSSTRYTYIHQLYMQFCTTQFAYRMAGNIKLPSQTFESMFYAILVMLAEYQNPSETPMFLHTLFGVVMYRMFPFTEMKTLFWDEQAEPIIVNTEIPHILTRQQITMLETSIPPAEIAFTTVNQYVYEQAHIILPPRLRIETIWVDFLKSIGMTDAEAYAMCGYIQAANQSDITINLLNNALLEDEDEEYDDWDFDDEEDGLNKPSKITPERYKEIIESMPRVVKQVYSDLTDGIREQLMQEVQDDIQDAKEQQERAETAKRKLEREHRMVSHRAKTAESKLKTLEQENEELKAQLLYLQSQQETMQNAILDITKQEETPDNEPEKNLYPLDIGKDIKIYVYGGSRNWVSEQQRRFPNITFVEANTLPVEQQISYADIVIVNTFVCSHKFFWRIQNVAKRSNVPVNFIDHPGINKSSQCILSIYQKYVADHNVSGAADPQHV